MSKSNSRVKTLPYPAIEDGNFSFPDAVYEVEPKLSGNPATKVTLRHELTGAPFIEELIQKRKAQFACLLSVPKTGFRKLCVASSNEQEIIWDLDVVGEPPILGPVIVYVSNRSMSHELTKQDGVSRIWQNQKIEIQKGARLAKGRYLRTSNTMQRLIKVKCIESMKKGRFTVKENSNDGFYFSLEAAHDIFQFLQNPQGSVHLRTSILVHAVTQGLNILFNKYKEGTWEQHSNLKSLSNLLEDKGLAHWNDEDDFDSARVATELYPIEVPRIEKGK